jgi:hypothetical protein
VVATPGALEALESSGQSPSEFLRRHVRLDPGDFDRHDQAANKQALRIGARVFSAYRTKLGERVWVIMEADRSSTCLLLPSEY